MDLERGERIPLFPIMQNANDSEDDPATATLPPLMVSVGEDDFLVTTGTAIMDPAIGLFVNLNGDPVRGTLMFSTYPRALSILCFILANQSNQLSPSFCHDARL
jgi:vacuolar protein sorting-associated protein 3